MKRLAWLFCALLSFPRPSLAAEKVTGVGLALTRQHDRFVVAGVVPGSPAFTEGVIRAGDELTAVKPFAGEGWLPVDKLSLDELVQLVRGEAGSRIALHLSGSREQYEVTLTRASFESR